MKEPKIELTRYQRFIENIMHTFIILILLTTSCTKKNDWVRYSLHGKVKSCYETYYEAENKFGEWTNGDISYYNHNRVSFTNNGVYGGTEYFDDEGKLNSKSIPKYEDGIRIGECQYDQDGKLIGKTKINHISSKVIEIISYDESGRTMSKGRSFLKKNLFTGGDYETFDNGKLTGKSKTIIVHDQNGNIQSWQVIDEKGQEKYFLRYEYLEFDKMHNWIKRITFNSKNSNKPEDFVIREIVYF